MTVIATQLNGSVEKNKRKEMKFIIEESWVNCHRQKVSECIFRTKFCFLFVNSTFRTENILNISQRGVGGVHLRSWSFGKS